jgi:hypothetical protein
VEPNLEPTEPTKTLSNQPSRRSVWSDELGPPLRQGLGVATVILLPLAVIAGGIAVLALLVDDRRLLLDYLRTLVWPVVVVVVLFWLRGPIREKLHDLLEFSAAGASAKFARAKAADEALAVDIGAAAKALVLEGDPNQPAPEIHVDDHAEGAATQPLETRSVRNGTSDASEVVKSGDLEDEAYRRVAIEKIIRESAGWGWDMAQIGFKTRPNPIIKWHRDGTPHIISGEGITDAPSKLLVSPWRFHRAPDYDRQEHARRLERMIQELTEEAENPAAVQIGDSREVNARKIQALKTQLRQIDPNSAWAH